MIASGIEANLLDRPGGIFVRHADQIASEDRILIQSSPVQYSVTAEERWPNK